MALSSTRRSELLRSVADALIRRHDDIMIANDADVAAAEHDAQLKDATRQRLSIKKGKLETLAKGIQAIADMQV